MNWLLVNTLIASALAVLVLAIGRWLRPAPAVMHVLWVFVVLKLVTPPLVSIPVDTSWLQAAPAAITPLVVPIELDAITGHLRTAVPLAAIAALVVDEPRRTVSGVVAPIGVSWQQAGLCLWALGSVVMFGWLGLGLWRGQRRLRALGAVPPSLQREVRELARQLSVRAPALLDDPNVGSPYVWSFGRTRLVLPVAVLTRATAKGRAAVLVHELAHLRRGDHWLAHGELLLAVVLWWHPLFWFARARLRLWAELACDAWAIGCVPDATIDYATVLVQAVARPDSAVYAPAVLAARPAARAAFETRLTMILNENVPCRAPRAWWLPLTSLALGLFAVPVAAQRESQDPVQVEIRINGKQVDELSSAERQALLRKLLAAEQAPAKVEKRSKADKAAKADKADKPAKPSKKSRPTDIDVAVEMDEAPFKVFDLRGNKGQDIGGLVRQGLAEARVEVLDDEDLRELGITDEVVKLLDDVGAGKGLESSLDAVIKAAMQGAGKMVEQELRADHDLKDLGITDGIIQWVNGFLTNERNQEMLSDLVMRTAKQAMNEAMVEVRADGELRELGIEGDVEALMENIYSGTGNFDVQLQTLIEKAVRGAMKANAGGDGEHEIVVEEKPTPGKKKAKKQKRELR